MSILFFFSFNGDLDITIKISYQLKREYRNNVIREPLSNIELFAKICNGY